MLKVHKKMVIINFANKWEIIIIIRDKKNLILRIYLINSLSGEKNRGKILVGKKKVGEKFSDLQNI